LNNLDIAYPNIIASSFIIKKTYII
jgi:hypothetical protein